MHNKNRVKAFRSTLWNLCVHIAASIINSRTRYRVCQGQCHAFSIDLRGRAISYFMAS